MLIKLFKNKLSPILGMGRPATIERKFMCDYCECSYSYQSGISRHMSEKHPEAKGKFSLPLEEFKTESLDDAYKSAKSTGLIVDGTIRFSKNWLKCLVKILSSFYYRPKRGKIWSKTTDTDEPYGDSFISAVIEKYISTLKELVENSEESSRQHRLLAEIISVKVDSELIYSFTKEFNKVASSR